MCGRYTLYRSKMDYENALADVGGLVIDSSKPPHEIPPNYNVSPTQAVWIARNNGTNIWLEPVMWGLKPRWAKEGDKGPLPINARSETVATNKLFAPLLRTKRCLVPCDGYYEWKATAAGKQPYLIRMKSGAPFFFAGLYDIWHEEKPDQLATFTTMTCPPSEALAHIHDRMPVIVKSKDYERWLDTTITDPQAFVDILQPYPAEELTAHPVSKRVSSPRNQGPDLMEPLDG